MSTKHTRKQKGQQSDQFTTIHTGLAAGGGAAALGGGVAALGREEAPLRPDERPIVYYMCCCSTTC